MKLHVLKEGSKKEIRLGFCCSPPWTFSLWAEGDEKAYLQPSTSKHIDQDVGYEALPPAA